MARQDEQSRRLVEAAVALLDAAGGKMNITVLNKALFYLDLIALRDDGETMTGTKYVALKQGPVVANYEKKLVKALARAGYAQQFEEGLAKPIQLVERPDRYEHITDEDLSRIAKVAKVIGRMKSTEASDFSHKNPAWQRAEREGVAQGRAAAMIDMLLAMQQLLDPDDWLAAELSNAEQQLIESSAAATALWE